MAMDLFAEEQWEQAKAGFESAIEQGDMRVSRCYNGIGLCRYFDGKYEHTFFGQFEHNTNVYLSARYSF